MADAIDLESIESIVRVQVPLTAPNNRNPNLVPIGNRFGFVIFIDYPNFNAKHKN